MKPGLPPTPPDDETPDPLLTTLRQRLGDYGAPPPPAAWAAIRQRVAAPPRPWWRRPRRLLPLLALLLGLVLVGILAVPRGQLAGQQPVAHREASASSSGDIGLSDNKLISDATPGRSANNGPNRPNPSAPGQPASADPSHPLAATLPTATEAATRRATASARRLAPAVSAARSARQRGAKAAGVSAMAGRPAAQQRHSASIAAASTRKLKPALAGADNRLHRRTPETSAAQNIEHKLNNEYASRQKATAAALRAATLQADSRQATARLAGGRSLPSTQRVTRKATVATSESAAATRLAGTQQTRSQLLAAMPTSPRRSRRQAAQRAGSPAQLPASTVGALEPATTLGRAPAAQPEPTSFRLPLFTERGAAIDLLALKQAGLLLPEAAQPTIPPAQPDSTPPAHAVRRWSVLVLAGPTLSYRTLGAAPTLAASHPDFARLERPALGLGAQAQVRRVLSGRWALAVGVGYQEYATQLALSVNNSGTYTTIRQRDTYRLLTLPAQFTYALGAPHGRLALGLLLGAEPGRYLGGRSTEGSDCGCQQRAYPADSAQTSPYHAWSLAFSLGLDLRYRLGGPASRWRLVVQPTGRYVATPFVRSDAVGFTRRQPFSLGLLTGFSWDLR